MTSLTRRSTLKTYPTNLDSLEERQVVEKLYTIAEVADKLNLSAKTLRRWEEAGRFTPSRTLGGQRRYSIEDLQILDAIKHGTIPDQKDLLTLQQAAALFGVSPATIDRWENEGKIHPLITAGNTYYPRTRLMSKLGQLQTEMLPQMERVPYTPPPSYEEPPAPQTIVDTPSTPERTVSPHPRDHHSDVPRLSTLSTTEPTSARHHRAWLHRVNVDTVIVNTAITLTLLAGYYFLTRPFKLVEPVTPTSLLQAVTPAIDPDIMRIKSMIDPTGNITAPSLTLLPGIAPEKPAPGTLYFDTGSQAYRYYTNGKWNDLVPAPASSASAVATPAASIR